MTRNLVTEKIASFSGRKTMENQLFFKEGKLIRENMRKWESWDGDGTEMGSKMEVDVRKGQFIKTVVGFTN